MKKIKNYPLYETTVFEDFRIMTENAAEKFGDRTAFAYREKHSDKEVKTVSYNKVREDVRAFGTALISLGLRDKHCAIVGCNSVGWIYSYFALMSIGAVTVPIDKEMPAEDIASVINRSESVAVFYTADVSEKIAKIKETASDMIFVSSVISLIRAAQKPVASTSPTNSACSSDTLSGILFSPWSA